MDANHRFELLATVFYMTTGMMAPGKDIAAARGVDDYEERAITFASWCSEYKRINDAWLKCLEAQIESE